MPLINEAAYCVMEGVATVEAVDAVMKLGMNHPMGAAGTGGFYWARRVRGHYACAAGRAGRPEVSSVPTAQEYVAAGWLGRKSGRGFLRLLGYSAQGRGLMSRRI